jgi:glutamate 5-kinase
VQGVVVVNADTGRALRAMPVAIKAADVLGCSGDFHAGDQIYVTSRGRDGGQYAIAIGTAEIDASALRGLRVASGNSSRELPQALDAVAAEGLHVLWRLAV